MSLYMIQEDLFILKGSPSTLFYFGDDNAVIIDPGHGSKRAKTIEKILKKQQINRENIKILLTHPHTDHVDVLAKKPNLASETIINELDKPSLEHPLYRVTLTFGLPLGYESKLLLYKPQPVKTTSTFTFNTQKILEAKIVPLPGHTPGHTGYIIGNVLYAGDALFGEKVLERYIAPYHLNPCQALESLRRLENLYEQGVFTTIVPGHGPVVAGDEALLLIKDNIGKLEETFTKILDLISNKPMSIEEITIQLPGARKIEKPGLLVLAQAGVKGVLSCLEEKGEVEARVNEGRLLWSKI